MIKALSTAGPDAGPMPPKNTPSARGFHWPATRIPVGQEMPWDRFRRGARPGHRGIGADRQPVPPAQPCRANKSKRAIWGTGSRAGPCTIRKWSNIVAQPFPLQPYLFCVSTLVCQPQLPRCAICAVCGTHRTGVRVKGLTCGGTLFGQASFPC